jgi:NADPH:quinone reductase-like Zn-dependent oxidoreductase
MKAVVYTEYGSPDVLHLTEIEKPTPKDNEILIKIQARPVGFGDVLVRNFKSVSPGEFNMPSILWLPTRLIFGIRKPRVNILGAELAGDVEAIGKDVTRFKVGDQVFAYPGQTFGANAEYLCMDENKTVALKPENMSYEEAATIPYGGVTALLLLEKANIQPGQNVLINGASGSIGSVAVQLAKSYGAQVTGVCGTSRVDYVKALGADTVIDYSKEDFTQNGESYDLILDVLGKSSFSKVSGSLTSNGRILYASFKMRKLFQMLWTKLVGSKKVICALAVESQDDLVTVKELVEAGTIKTVVGRVFPLEQTAEAHRYYESSQRKGNVVITSA